MNRRGPWALGIGLALGVLLLFRGPLTALVKLAADNDLHSHLPLIPFISGYLWFVGRDRLPPASPGGRTAAAVAAGVGVIALTGGLALANQGQDLAPADQLLLPMIALVALTVAGACLCCGPRLVRRAWFPLAFLVFMVPLPTGMSHGISVWLQHASADVSFWMLRLAGTPVFRDGMTFAMPGLTVEVAEQCSGIRSSLVLLITSVLAGHLFLDRGWKQAALVAAVVPLGIARNAIRIVSLSLLTIHVDERVIDSPLHHRGGPIFFVLSLVVLFALLFLLRGIGRAKPGPGSTEAVA